MPKGLSNLVPGAEAALLASDPAYIVSFDDLTYSLPILNDHHQVWVAEFAQLLLPKSPKKGRAFWLLWKGVRQLRRLRPLPGAECGSVPVVLACPHARVR